MKLNKKDKKTAVNVNTPPKKRPKALYKLVILLTNLVGFPLLLTIVAITCAKYNESGIYKITVFLPCLLVVALWGVTALIQMLIFRGDKKHHASFKHTMISCAVVPICVLAGLFLVLDIFLPKLLAQATSSTIFYEDIVVDAKGQHDLILSKAQLFLDKNNLYEYEKNPDGSPKAVDEFGKPVPTLDANGKKKYYYWFSEENMAIFKPIFSSFDQAYQSFNGLAIEYALSGGDLVSKIISGEIPITVLTSIVLRTTPPEDVNGSNVKLGLLEVLTLNKEPLVNAVKALIATGFDFSPTGKDPYTGKDEIQALDDILKAVLVHKEYEGVRWNVLQLLGENPISNVDPNKQIIQNEGKANEKVLGACLGYQDMAWLNSVDLLGIIICLMNCRSYFYLFGVLIGMLTYIEFVLKKQYLMAYGEDCLLLPKSKRRKAKEQKNDWHYSVSNVNGVMNIGNDVVSEYEKEEIKEEVKAEKSLGKSFGSKSKKSAKEKAPKPPKPEKIKKEKAPKPPKPEKVKKEKAPKPPKPKKPEKIKKL